MQHKIVKVHAVVLHHLGLGTQRLARKGADRSNEWQLRNTSAIHDVIWKYLECLSLVFLFASNLHGFAVMILLNSGQQRLLRLLPLKRCLFQHPSHRASEATKASPS